MPFLKSMPENAGPPVVYTKYPDLYGPWSKMSEAMMNGPSPFSQAERELLFSYAAGVADCKFVYVAHSEVAYAWGVPPGTLDRLMENLDTAPVESKLKAVCAFIRKLVVTPNAVGQADVDAVLAAGWDEHALQDSMALAGRALFMRCLVAGHGFIPMNREEAAARAKKRLEHGYVNLYSAFREKK